MCNYMLFLTYRTSLIFEHSDESIEVASTCSWCLSPCKSEIYLQRQTETRNAGSMGTGLIINMSSNHGVGGLD